MVELLSIKEISQKIGVPQSTLRYYRDLFTQYLPSSGEGKKKRFFPESINVFAAIAKGMRQNKTSGEIAKELDSKFARFIDVNNDDEPIAGNSDYAAPDNDVRKDTKNNILAFKKSHNSEATKPQNEKNNQLQILKADDYPDNNTILSIIYDQNKAIEQLASTLHLVNEHQEEIQGLKDEMYKLEYQFEDQLTSHFQLVDNRLRQITGEILQRKKPKSFWQRIFG